MASIVKDSNGRRAIQFVGADKRRRTIRLGKMPLRMVESLKSRVEQLNAAAISGHAVDPDTARWLAGIETALAEKLAAVGLIAERETATLGEFLDTYLAGRTDVNVRTRANNRQCRNYLTEFFGERRQLRSITPGDADDFRRWLSERLGDNTTRRHCGRAKQFFLAALRKLLVETNPFGDMKQTSVVANKSRDHFVTRDDAAKVLEACPNAEWKLLFALARFGGLRTPSEVFSLRWIDIDWERGRMLVRSPKTQKHAGHESRIVPIFPEVRPYLEAVFENPKGNREFVISSWRKTETNLRSQLERIIVRAGLSPWGKLFQNLRSSRATELAAEFPAHVAADWLGHSTLVAAKHYWRTQDSDFEKAIAGGEKIGSKIDEKRAAESEALGALQFQELQENAGNCTASLFAARAGGKEKKPPVFPVFPADFSKKTVLPTGFEPVLPD